MIVYFLIALSSFLQQDSLPLSLQQSTYELKQLEWILGDWELINKDSKTIESWKKTDDFRYDGRSILINKEDTMVLETIQLISTNNDIFYIADVEHNKAPVSFKLIKLTANSAVFENKEHDFPQQIAYELNNDKLRATISGVGKNGKLSFFDFTFNKIPEHNISK